MKFGRDAEREADLLGLEYEYLAGYDPQAFVQFFEKLHIKEKRKHNFISKAFATHPMTQDRIQRAQIEIATLLPDKNEYIVDTNEFQEVKSRLADIMHEHAPSDGGRPVLHRRTREDDILGVKKGRLSADRATSNQEQAVRVVFRFGPTRPKVDKVVEWLRVKCAKSIFRREWTRLVPFLNVSSDRQRVRKD